MARLIDADALCNRIRERYDGYMLDEGGCCPLDFEDMVEEQPTVYNVDEFINKAVDEIETKVYKDAVCVGCGYLKDNICTYKGSACGVSKPMLEAIKRVFENIRKGGVNENNN